MSEEMKAGVAGVFGETETQAAPQTEVVEAPAPKKKGPLGTVIAILAVVVLGFAAMCGIAMHDISESGQVYDPNAAATSQTGSDLSAGIAATVNGVPVGEADVTAYIQTVRAGMEMTDDADWAMWLADNELTDEQVRDQSIDYFVEMELIIQAAEKQEVTVDETAIEQQLATIRAGFESEEAFQEAMTAAGLDEASLRKNIRLQMLQEGIETKLTEAAPEAAKETAASEWLQSFVNSAVIEKTDMPEGLPYAVAAK